MVCENRSTWNGELTRTASSLVLKTKGAFNSAWESTSQSSSMEYKICTHCKRVLPYSSFTFRDKTHARLNSWCRDCQKQKTKEIRLSNIEEYKLKDKKRKKKYIKGKELL